MVYRLGKVWSSIGFVIIFYIGLPAIGASQSDKVPHDVIEKAETEGSVLVLVGLKVPSWQREDTLTDDAVQTQRQAIAEAQSHLIAELAGTHHRVIRQYQEIPGIALEVGSDALAIIEKSDGVTNVLRDRPALASLNTSPPSATLPVTPTTPSPAVPAGKVPPEIFKIADHAGSVLVLVGLRAPWEPEGPMSEALVTAQRNAIAASQNYLLVELAGTHYRITRLYRRIPGIALEVGSDALKVLAESPAVTNVLEDRPPKSKD